MKKIVPFTKDITFKTKIGEITSITLDHTLKLNNQFVGGEFIITGTYKIIPDGETEEKFNYQIPVDITIDNKYDTTKCKVSIDDFSYEIINEETLKVNISVLLDELELKNDIIEEITIDDSNDRELEYEMLDQINEEIPKIKSDESKVETKFEEELFEKIDSKSEYSIYRVYKVQENDTIDEIIEKYKIPKEILADYNDLDNITIGSKLIIPSIDE